MPSKRTAPNTRGKPARRTVAVTTKLPVSWQAQLRDELEKPYFQQLQAFLAAERTTTTVYPPDNEVYSAFAVTPYDNVKVLILGQDPYHDEGQAHGLAFSVRPGVTLPPTLRNMLKELHSDIGCRMPNNGYLVPWAAQGVLLLNAVLTVRAHQPNSHKNKGWETFTDTVIERVSAKKSPVVFVLWGAYARKKVALINRRHTILESVHPSPLSATHGFFGSRPYSTINCALRQTEEKEIDWCLPEV